METIYKLTLDGENLVASELVEDISGAIRLGQDKVTFPNGKKIEAFYKLREEGYGMVFSSFDYLVMGDNIYFPLYFVEDLNSSSPVNGFSWEGETLAGPNHIIKLIGGNHDS